MAIEPQAMANILLLSPLRLGLVLLLLLPWLAGRLRRLGSGGRGGGQKGKNSQKSWWIDFAFGWWIRFFVVSVRVSLNPRFQEI